MSESEQNTSENIRVCREEKPASCELCLKEFITESHAVSLCVQCCLYYCDKHNNIHSRPLAPNEKHTEIAFNETKEVRNRNFKLYLEELKGDNLDSEFDIRKISFSGIIHVKHESRDSKRCRITEIVLLNDGRLALVDRNNHCIKFFNLESQKITSYMHIRFKPKYLSEYEIGKGVVTCQDSLLFIDRNTHSIINKIHTDDVCRCVGSLRNMFIVSFTNTDNIMPSAYIQIMNRDGKELKRLRSLRNVPVFNEPYYLVVDKDRELFYVLESRLNKVKCFNVKGTMLNSFKHGQLHDPLAMAIGPDGDVYVFCIMLRNVHKLSPLLKESQIIIDKSWTEAVTTSFPMALCISSQTMYTSQVHTSPAGDYISSVKEE